MAENILYRSTESDDEEYYSCTDFSDTETLEEEMYIDIEKLSVNEGVWLQIQEIRVNERERMRRERTEIFNNSHDIVYDRVEVKHELDREDCFITGLCVLENKRWVACDCYNRCIKIYEVGSHVLQRYIRFVESKSKPEDVVESDSRPWDVTEIHLKQNSAEPNFASASSSHISAADRDDPDKQCVIAVTLPYKRQILFIDTSNTTAKVLKTERKCWSIQFHDDKIFTLCGEVFLSPSPVSSQGRPDSPCSVYIQSTDGVPLNMFDIGFYGRDLAVVSGRVYITDWSNHKVQCRDFEGKFIPGFTMEGSGHTGISVHPDNNVYVCAYDRNKVCKLKSDRTSRYIEKPYALCCYRDKLFISHDVLSSERNFVTMVPLF